MPRRPTDPVQSALSISWLSIGCSAASGVASITIGSLVGSLALLGSGASVLVDLSSSAVLVWRFRQGRHHPTAERRAHFVAALALVLLGLSLAAVSIQRLLSGGSAHPNTASLVVAAAAVLALPGIAARKYVVARQVPSGALRADAHITVMGAVTAMLTVLGLVMTKAGLDAGDATAALVVAIVVGAIGLNELRQPAS